MLRHASDGDSSDDDDSSGDGLWWPLSDWHAGWAHSGDSSAYASSVSGDGQDEEEEEEEEEDGGGFSYRATSLRCEGEQQGADLDVAP
jgi:hypothetical protein